MVYWISITEAAAHPTFLWVLREQDSRISEALGDCQNLALRLLKLFVSLGHGLKIKNKVQSPEHKPFRCHIMTDIIFLANICPRTKRRKKGNRMMELGAYKAT